MPPLPAPPAPAPLPEGRLARGPPLPAGWPQLSRSPRSAHPRARPANWRAGSETRPEAPRSAPNSCRRVAAHRWAACGFCRGGRRAHCPPLPAGSGWLACGVHPALAWCWACVQKHANTAGCRVAAGRRRDGHAGAGGGSAPPGGDYPDACVNFAWLECCMWQRHCDTNQSHRSRGMHRGSRKRSRGKQRGSSAGAEEGTGGQAAER